MVGRLREGGCPNLRVLDLSHNEIGSSMKEALAATLQSGHCRKLQDLNLADTHLGPGGLQGITQALQCGCCPDLRKLDVSGCDLVSRDGLMLGEALGLSRACCSLLEELILARNEGLGDEGVVPVLEAVRRGGCQHLRRLDLSACHLTEVGGRALGRALRGGGCGELRRLLLFDAFVDRVGSLEVLQAILSGACDKLVYLCLSGYMMDTEHADALSEALTGGHLRYLEELDLSNNERLGDEGMARIMLTLGNGTCPDLRQLTLWKVGRGEVGAAALASALGSGSLSHLRGLHLADYNLIGDVVMSGIIAAMSSGTCPELESLQLNRTGLDTVACQCLCHALHSGAWPHLTRLLISEDPLIALLTAEIAAVLGSGAGQALKQLCLCSSTAVGIRKLAEAFEGGACPSLEYMLLIANEGDIDCGSIEVLETALGSSVRFDLKIG